MVILVLLMVMGLTWEMVVGVRETAVMTGGSDAFVGNGGGNERDCCRLPGFI